MGIEQDDVCVVTDRDPSFANQPPNSGWRVAPGGGDPRQIDPLLSTVVRHKGQIILDRRHTAGTGGVGLRFFLERMGGVIGRDDLDRVVSQGLP